MFQTLLADSPLIKQRIKQKPLATQTHEYGNFYPKSSFEMEVAVFLVCVLKQA